MTITTSLFISSKNEFLTKYMLCTLGWKSLLFFNSKCILHTKDGFKGNHSLISWMLAPLVCKKRQYQGEIALATNLRPLMSEQLLKFGYILYCLNGEYISFTHKKHPRGASIHEIKESFPMKPSLVPTTILLPIFSMHLHMFSQVYL